MAAAANRDLIYMVHFNPIERYPPVMNLITVMEQLNPEVKLVVYTTHPADTGFRFQAHTDAIRIVRKGDVGRGLPLGTRVWSYFRFHFSLIWSCFIRRPVTLMYFETISALVPFLYKKFINPTARILVHYHEYVSPREYLSGMSLIRLFHSLEKKLYPACHWVSQTNKERMAMFLSDEKARLDHTHILPNFPPRSWSNHIRVTELRSSSKIGFVYIGALDLEHMYTREVAAFMARNTERFIWHIYSDNISPEAAGYLKEQAPPNVAFKGSVAYTKLPEVLSDYQVGLVLYKGHLENFVYNIPNKLYEYHVCGLDVWFPHQLTSAKSLETQGTYPVIRGVDFERLEEFAPALCSHEGLAFHQYAFEAEQAVGDLLHTLLDKREQ